MKLTHSPDYLLDKIIHRDGMMLVINKPAGLTVHAKPGAAGNPGESLEDYFTALRFGLPRDPALAHRLDRDTTGCLILGRHPKALRKLHKLFFERRIEKTYWAICAGAPASQSGTITVPLRKRKTQKNWRMEIASDNDEDALHARTTYRVLAQNDVCSFIEAKPKTGRTHQLRVHLASIGAPIMGDPIYGDPHLQSPKASILLHARRVIVPMSKNRDADIIEAPAPPAMATRLKNDFQFPTD